MIEPNSPSPQHRCSSARQCDRKTPDGERFCPECKPGEVAQGRNPHFYPNRVERHRWSL